MSEKLQQSFSEYLADIITTQPPATKGELTRLRLIAAAAKLLDEISYHDLRMLDVASKAGVSNGAVYSYFKDKRDITIVVFSEFIRFTQSSLLKFRIPPDIRRALGDAYTFYVKFYAQNVGLMAAMRHLSIEIPEIGKMLEDGYARWSTQLAVLLKALGKESPFLNDAHAAWTIRALSVMAAEFLFDLYARKSEMLAALRDQPEVTGELLASMWMRICVNQNTTSTPASTDANEITPGDYLPLLVNYIKNQPTQNIAQNKPDEIKTQSPEELASSIK